MEKTESRLFELPKELESSIEKILKQHNVRLGDSNTIAAHIQKMSDFYIANPREATPWNESWAVVAQLAYYLPLNFLRCKAVVEEGKRLGFFKNLYSVNEVGSGIGALTQSLAQIINRISCLEISKKANQLHLDLSKIPVQFLQSEKDLKADLFAASYVLTEVAHLEKYLENYKALLIIEPSTSQDSRALMELRKRLIAKGFHIWAPCTHQKNCPLLEESKKDWCHDRIHIKMPDWFLDIEKFLPFKNKTITFSYLLARKDLSSPQTANLSRVIGDLLPEKGKTRIMVCRQDKREFLSWLHKDKIDPAEIHRGDLLDLNQFQFEEKSNELRLKK